MSIAPAPKGSLTKVLIQVQWMVYMGFSAQDPSSQGPMKQN
jgi:hypothetical protein